MLEQIILASASPVRRRLLEAAGLNPRIVVSSIDESIVRRTLTQGDQPSDPSDIAEMLARAKAEDVSAQHPEACVVGADQVLALDGRVFEKPSDVPAARETLHALSGRLHELHSAAAIAVKGEIVWSHVDTACMSVRPLSLSFIEDYLLRAGADVCESVGAYKLEGLGVNLFDKIEGDYFTILGLPLLPLLAEFRLRGLMPQ